MQNSEHSLVVQHAVAFAQESGVHALDVRVSIQGALVQKIYQLPSFERFFVYSFEHEHSLWEDTVVLAELHCQVGKSKNPVI